MNQPVHMDILCNALTAILMIIGCLVLTQSVSASGEITAYLGDTITLQGYSTGSPEVYLFLTGPNLPVNGVTLNDITARADEGYFTEASVSSDDHWEYIWVTKGIGGRLDAGTYTVWVTDRPNDRSRLAQADYNTISVRLRTPEVKVNSPEIPGALVLNTSPDGASVLIDDVFRGNTPLVITTNEPGIYWVTFSLPGYRKLTTSVRVESGKTTEINGILIPLAGSVNITTRPAGAMILLDTINLGATPILIHNLTVGNHTITVVKEGYVPAENPVTVDDGLTTQISIILIPASTPLTDTSKAAGPAPAPMIAGFLIIFLAIRYMRREW